MRKNYLRMLRRKHHYIVLGGALCVQSASAQEPPPGPPPGAEMRGPDGPGGPLMELLGMESVRNPGVNS
jgi:hypothetical protein